VTFVNNSAHRRDGSVQKAEEEFGILENHTEPGLRDMRKVAKRSNSVIGQISERFARLSRNFLSADYTDYTDFDLRDEA